MTANQLINKYINIRYRSNGRIISTGLDCWGLIMHVIKDIHGVELPDANYSVKTLVKNKRNIFADENIEKWLTKVQNIKYGDVILFYSLANLPIHAGIYVGNKRFMHSSSPYGVKVDELSKFKTKIAGYYRINNIND